MVSWALLVIYAFTLGVSNDYLDVCFYLINIFHLEKSYSSVEFLLFNIG